MQLPTPDELQAKTQDAELNFVIKKMIESAECGKFWANIAQHLVPIHVERTLKTAGYHINYWGPDTVISWDPVHSRPPVTEQAK